MSTFEFHKGGVYRTLADKTLMTTEDDVYVGFRSETFRLFEKGSLVIMLEMRNEQKSSIIWFSCLTSIGKLWMSCHAPKLQFELL